MATPKIERILKAVLTSLALVFTISFVGLEAHADNIVGYLAHGAGNAPQLKVQNSDPVLTIQAGSDVLSILADLRDGSLIIGTGYVNASAKTVQIDAVQTVGLKELLGKWQSSTEEIFEFKSFSKLMRYVPASNTEGSAQGPRPKIENFDYALSPDREKSFSIFMTDREMRMLVGTLHFVDKSVLLTVYNSQTGQEAEKISLSPLPLKDSNARP